MSSPRLKLQLEAAKAQDLRLDSHQPLWDPRVLDDAVKSLSANAPFTANAASRASAGRALAVLRRNIRNGSTSLARADVGLVLLKETLRHLLDAAGARLYSPVAFPISRCALESVNEAVLLLRLPSPPHLSFRNVCPRLRLI